MQRLPLQNRRVRPRIDVLLQANFEIAGKSLPDSECLMTNISVSGVALVFPGFAEDSISKGHIITLEFSLPGSDRHIYAQGEIIWTNLLEDALAAGVNFFEPLSFKEILRFCVEDSKKSKDD